MQEAKTSRISTPVLSVAGVVFLFVWVAWELGPASSTLWAKQESNPITSRVIPEQVNADPGTKVAFTVVLETQRRFPAMELAVKMPEGVDLMEGDLRQTFGDFNPGETRRFVFSFRVNDREEQLIFFTARALGLADEAVSQVALAVVNPKGSDRSVIETDKQGRSYRVFGIE